MTNSQNAGGGSADPNASKPRKTALFALAMVGVFLVFAWLASLGGPPLMPKDKDHHGLTDDNSCFECHNWPEFIAKGASPVKSPMGPHHPPPRLKKRRPIIVDGGAVVPTTPQYECLKCHTGR